MVCTYAIAHAPPRRHRDGVVVTTNQDDVGAGMAVTAVTIVHSRRSVGPAAPRLSLDERGQEATRDLAEEGPVATLEL